MLKGISFWGIKAIVGDKILLGRVNADEGALAVTKNGCEPILVSRCPQDVCVETAVLLSGVHLTSRDVAMFVRRVDAPDI